MQKLVTSAAALLILFAHDVIADELIVYVDPEQAQEVIERNEMQYEELRWHSFPDHVRIAKINIPLLHELDVAFTITPFDDVLPVLVKSNGITRGKWAGTKTRGRIPEDALKEQLAGQGATEAIYDELLKQFNIVELGLRTVLLDRASGETIGYQGQYQIMPGGEEVGPVFSNVPVFAEEKVEEITIVYGNINVADTAGMPGLHRTYTIKPLDKDPEYVMIYEWDNSKNHHLMDPPHDPDAWDKSELGQKYARLREEKEAYLAKVAERIAERNRQRQEQD